jgi:hypothetical protein
LFFFQPGVQLSFPCPWCSAVRGGCHAGQFGLGAEMGYFPVQHGNLVLQGMDFVQEDFAEELELFVLESGFGDVLFALVEVQLFAFELCELAFEMRRDLQVLSVQTEVDTGDLLDQAIALAHLEGEVGKQRAGLQLVGLQVRLDHKLEPQP